MLALVSELNCFLRSRCSMEMWCPDNIGRDSWDWVGPPAWVRACFNSPEWSGGSSPVKTELPRLYYCCCCLRHDEGCAYGVCVCACAHVRVCECARVRVCACARARVWFLSAAVCLLFVRELQLLNNCNTAVLSASRQARSKDRNTYGQQKNC